MAGHVGKAGLGVGIRRVLPARFPGGVVRKKTVMHHRARIRPELHRLEPFILGQIQGHHEAAVNIPPFRRHGEWLGHFHDEIGRAQLPTGSEFGQCRQLCRVALGHAGLHPPGKGVDLLLRKAAVAVERHAALGRMPRWHHAVLRDAHDQPPAFAHVVEVQQRKGPGLAGAMAGSAVVENNGSHVLREGDVRRSIQRGKQGGKKNRIFHCGLDWGSLGMKQPTHSPRGLGTGRPASTAFSALRRSCSVTTRRGLPKSS